MRRTVLAAGAAAVLTLGMVSTALAWPEYVEGRPEQFEVGGERVKDGVWLAFRLYVDGHAIAPHNVYVGAEGTHPPDATFRVHW